MDFFKDIKEESVINAQEVKITIDLPKEENEILELIIDSIPFEIETPNSQYGDKAWQMGVKNSHGIEANIFIPDGLIFHIAVAMKKMDLKYSDKNMEKLIGKTLIIWRSFSNKDKVLYYACSIKETEIEQ